MILLDDALEARERGGDPIRVAMVGAGFMGRGIALQIATATKGMELVAISNRHVDRARDAYAEAGIGDVAHVRTERELAAALAGGVPAVTQDALLVASADEVDAIVEVTGSIDFAAEVAFTAIEHSKHVVLMNAEVDATVGPILKRYADDAGVVITNADGDQPGVQLNLYRFVRGIGVEPVLCGNIKGLHDPYRNPETQAEFARRWGQNPRMVTAFADGSKISFEQAIVANATGMRVAKRGMHGLTVEAGTPIEEASRLFPQDDMMDGGIVDYVVGAVPSPGVFVLGRHDHPTQRHYLELYKLGEGPFYCFYTPYHLCHFEVPNTIARAVLFGDAAVAPAGAPTVDVVTAAKVDLKAGDTIDGVGGFTVYGMCENADVVAREELLPLGLSEGARLTRDVRRDDVLVYGDVELPGSRLSDRLRAEQNEAFAPEYIAGSS